jgi:acetyl esterase/lipase
MIHGGCWREQYSAAPLGGICRALTNDGYAVWTIEYRRVGNGGGYPQTLLDVAQATDMLRDVATEYQLDLARVTVVGHSAGGQLALWLAGRGRLAANSPVYSPNPLPFRGVVCLGGVIDLVNAVAQGICGEGLTMIMGGTPEAVPDHYQNASPMALLPLGVRQIHIVGDSDDNMANVQPYLEAAAAAGDDVRLIVPQNTGHFEVVTTGTPAWEMVREAVIELQR